MFTIIHIFFAFYNLDIFVLTTKQLYYAWFFWSLSSNSLIMVFTQTKILWYSYVTIETSIVNHSYSSPVEINIYKIKKSFLYFFWNINIPIISLYAVSFIKCEVWFPGWFVITFKYNFHFTSQLELTSGLLIGALFSALEVWILQ